MPNVGPMELIVVLVIAPVIVGPKRLPDLGRSLGNGMSEFKDSVTGRDRRERSCPAARPPLPTGTADRVLPTDATAARCTPRFPTRTGEIERARRACEPRTPPTSTANGWRCSARRPPSASPPDVAPLRSPRVRITLFMLARSPSPASAPPTSSARSEHAQLAYWTRVATTREAAARRDLHQVGRPRDAGSRGRRPVSRER